MKKHVVWRCANCRADNIHGVPGELEACLNCGKLSRVNGGRVRKVRVWTYSPAQLNIIF